MSEIKKQVTNANVEEIIDGAGLETDQPAAPSFGIPEQWLPKWIRKTVQCICYPFVVLDLIAQKIARFIVKPPFKKVGKCKRRGNCCHYVVMRHRKGPLGVIERFWATQINGFYYRNADPVEYQGKKVYLMGCRYLQKNGSCGNYRLRPMICRTWPVIEHFGWPSLLKGCGYHYKKTKVYDKLKVLD